MLRNTVKLGKKISQTRQDRIKATLNTIKKSGAAAAISKQDDPLGSGHVTCNSLNVRTGPGTNYERIGGLSEGKTFQVYEEKSGWLRIQYGTQAGWICKEFTDYVSPETPVTTPEPEPDPQPSFESFDVRVTSSDGLNVRNVPGNGENAAAGSSILGCLSYGTTVTVIGEQNGWYKINYNGQEAWICGTWTEKYDPTNPPSGSYVSNDGVPLYSQSDPAWGSRILCTYDTIASAGCAMTSTAMCLSKIAGYNITPADLDQYLDQHGGYTYNDCIYWGTAAGMIGRSATSTSMSGNKDTIDNNLNAGRPVVISVKAGGHYVCVAGRNNDGTYIIHDPAGGVVRSGSWNGSAIKVDGYSLDNQLVYFT